ncbi:hypothetical protein GCK72_011432 [Caenorhabditis remanei]|uniref:Uncharacterized protein n=1 Tax=Caenorhabditis remanei TaxID=31234 RepID=A0A6A5H8G7_CAERE|nr:hypothetical protein GCK72_011432 [Caenorhabditis remanei]KAF1763166.1 hypothetical protein GCK72_011432 [Caenorhabditis remanei]
MGNTNTIPVVSQVKSTIQLVTGDVEGAARTQERFFHEGIGVSQLTAVAYAATGNVKKAEETFDRGMNTISSAVDGIPVVGHVKGAVHYAMGDGDKGDRSMLSASRTASVMVGGAAGFVVGGPVGAVAGGMATGSSFDIGHTVITDKPQGYIGAVGEFVEKPSAGALFDAVAAPVGDAMAGSQGANILQSAKAWRLTAQAKTALAKAEAMSEGGGYTNGQVQAQYDVAQNLINKAESIRTGSVQNAAVRSVDASAEAATLMEQAFAEMEKAEQMVDARRAGAGYTEGQVIAQGKYAQSLYNKAESILTGGKPVPVFDPKLESGGIKCPGVTGPAVIAVNSRAEQQEKCQVSTTVSSSSSPTTYSYSFVSDGYKSSPTLVNECKLSLTEVKYYQAFQSVLEAYEKFDPLIDLSKYIIGCKQILKGCWRESDPNYDEVHKTNI